MDDISVAEAEQQSWLDHIAWMPQRPTLVADTVAGNVALGAPDATDGRSRRRRWRRLRVKASTPAGASRTTVPTSPRASANGSRSPVASCAARRGASVLLLDEPTAHLDAPTEQRILAAIRQLSVGRFVLMVAHRPAAIDFADRIVEIGAGITEELPMISAALS